jgi:hypothetical protein
LVHGYGSFFAGFLQAADYLVNVEAFQFAVFLSHHKLNGFHVLVCGEALSAGEAFFASTRSVLWRITCFQSFEFSRPTIRALHAFPFLKALLVQTRVVLIVHKYTLNVVDDI